ncbi:Fork head domain-containing protein FD5 [Anabarilius grahami]|uniref:Fork head domain-containing protein FD5 n=1 Tax=Anabarilius grahami TaxID=495550 RepID=A0A3N0Y3M6_ANAGA|nr:Fork head domain-containing protein FD5 [Anabarilius grahami]
MEDDTCRSNREQLGLQFTIDYLLYNKGRNTERVELEHSVPPSECLQTTVNETEQKTLSEQDSEKSEDQENEDNECEEEHEKTNLKSEGTDEKPAQSYIALISMAILDSEEKKLLLCDIYQWIMDHYPYFKSKDKNWRNSVRHNLSLNECFIKAGRSDNGKGHFWAIHPANFQDFSNGDYHRRRARRRIRRVTGQMPFALPAHYQTLGCLKRTPCWCCPPTHPLMMSFSPRVYWSWAALQRHHTPSLHGLI